MVLRPRNRIAIWVDDLRRASARAIGFVVLASAVISLGSLGLGAPMLIVVPTFVGVLAAAIFALVSRDDPLPAWVVHAVLVTMAVVGLAGAFNWTATYVGDRAEHRLPVAYPSSRHDVPTSPSPSLTPTYVVAADWTGQTFEDVEDMLVRQGVTVSRRDIVSTTHASEVILAQSVPAGSPLSSGSITFNVAVPPPPPAGEILSDARVFASDLAGFHESGDYEQQAGRGGFMSFSNPATGIYLCEGRPVSSDDVADTAVSSFEDNANFGIDHAVGSEITSFYGSQLSELFEEIQSTAKDCGGWRVRPMSTPRGAVEVLHLIADGTVVKGPIDEGDAPVDWVFIRTPNVLIQVRVATEDADQSDRAAALARKCLERLLTKTRRR